MSRPMYAHGPAETPKSLADFQFQIAEHVGDYGRPDGDIPATGEIRIFPSGAALADEWAVVAFATTQAEAASTAGDLRKRQGLKT